MKNKFMIFMMPQTGIFPQSDSLELDRDSPIANILTITDALILEDSPSYSNIEIENGFSVTLNLRIYFPKQ